MSPGTRAFAAFNLAAAAGLGVALTAKLWPDWTNDPDLSHGFVTPLACLLLLHESRVAGPWRPAPGGGAGAAGLAAGAGAAGLAGLALAGLFAAAVDWSGPLVDFSLACAFAAFGVGAVCAFADRRVAWIPLNWSSVLAVLIWPLAAPIPPGTCARLTLALQLHVTRGVLAALHLLGFAAHREGNIIDLAAGSVGVEDACSGVRSLVSCVFAGVLLSGTLVRTPGRRLALILLSAPLALAMNFMRSLLLTLLVAHGVAIAHGWHDATGYAVLVVTAGLLAGLGLALGRGAAGGGAGRRAAAQAPAQPPPGGTRTGSVIPGCQAVLSAVLALSIALTLFFVFQTRPRAARGGGGPEPDLEAIIPRRADGWAVASAGDLGGFSGILHTSNLVQRTYTRRDRDGLFEITLYAAHWKAGQAPVSLVATHTPDACWPGAGWILRESDSGRVLLRAAGRALPPAEHRIFANGAFAEQVWFWHLNGGRPLLYQDPRSPVALLKIALRYGFNPAGDQLFVRLSSNRPWSALAAEPLVADVLDLLPIRPGFCTPMGCNHPGRRAAGRRLSLASPAAAPRLFPLPL